MWNNVEQFMSRFMSKFITQTQETLGEPWFMSVLEKTHAANSELALSQREELYSHLLTELLTEYVDENNPDFLIGPKDDPYLRRWWIQRPEEAKKREQGCVYLHHIRHDDDDRALHDHPWESVSLILSGGIKEQFEQGCHVHNAGDIAYRTAQTAHRLELVSKDAWTLFVTGPWEREWGFHCKSGWVHWKDFTNPERPGEIGRGCGEHG